jgi:hypothetical protein
MSPPWFSFPPIGEATGVVVPDDRVTPGEVAEIEMCNLVTGV